MAIQPTKKKEDNSKKPRSRTKKRKLTKTEVIKKSIERSQKAHPKYGTSKLETRFAKQFLDKLGYKYEKQYFAPDIKRYYDFAIHTEHGLILVEVDGVYFHGKGLVHEEKNYMQKKSEYADEVKNEWARIHGIPLIRVWEDDINENPSGVMKMLREKIGIASEKLIISENKKKRH